MATLSHQAAVERHLAKSCTLARLSDPLHFVMHAFGLCAAGKMSAALMYIWRKNKARCIRRASVRAEAQCSTPVVSQEYTALPTSCRCARHRTCNQRAMKR